MKALAAGLLSPSSTDRIFGARMGPLQLTPPVDESISALAQQAAKIPASRSQRPTARTMMGTRCKYRLQTPRTQPAELFRLADLMHYWNPDWTLERAGFGGAGGGMTGIRGITYLDDDVLSTYPRDEIAGYPSAQCPTGR